MPVKFKNNAIGSLSSSISSSATSLPLQVGEGANFPTLAASEFTYVRLGTDVSNEVVKVTANSGDTLTCEATVSGWADDTAVIGTTNQESLDQFLQQEGAGVVAADLEFKDYAETRTTPSSSAGTLTLDIENGNIFEVTLTENVTTLNINNPPASGKAGSFTLILKQDGTGGYTVTWPAAVKWAGGTAPTLSSGPNDIDIITFLTTDAGTAWYGMTAGLDFS